MLSFFCSSVLDKRHMDYSGAWTTAKWMITWDMGIDFRPHLEQMLLPRSIFRHSRHKRIIDREKENNSKLMLMFISTCSFFFCRRGLSNRNIPVLCWWWFGNIGPHAGRLATHRAMALSPRHDVSQLLHSGSREESHKYFDDFIICWLRFFRDICFDFYFKILFKTIDSWSF